MTHEAPVYKDLEEIFSDVFMRDDMVLTPELTAKDIAGWDSFKQIEIMIAVEERFSIKLSTKEIDSFRCLGDLANLISKKR